MTSLWYARSLALNEPESMENYLNYSQMYQSLCWYLM